MNNILFNYLDEFYTIYLDNILIYSNNKLEYKHYIKKVLKWLYNTSLQIDLKKYEFYIICTKYLGFIISTNSIKVNPDKISIVKN
jgi:hypothetical protein